MKFERIFDNIINKVFLQHFFYPTRPDIVKYFHRNAEKALVQVFGQRDEKHSR